MPNYLPKYRVFVVDGLLNIYQDTLRLVQGNPGAFVAAYEYLSDVFPENDRITLLYQNRGLEAVFASQIFDGSNNQVGDLEDVQEYFISLGIGLGIGISQEEFDLYKAQQAQIIADIYAAIGGGGTVTKLSTPVPIASNITQTGATISWSAIPNATSYDVYLGNNLVLNVTTLNYTFAGLTAGQAYSAGVVAKGGAGFISSDKGVLVFTTTGTTPPSPNLPNIWNDNNIWNDTLIWQEIA